MRPKWAYILDEILNKNVSKMPIVDGESSLSWIKQSWHESEAKDSKLSKGVRNMLKTARKYNISLEPLKYSKEIKDSEPL